MPVRRLATTSRRHMTCLIPWMEKSNKSVSSFTRYIVSVTLQIQLFLTIYMCLGLCLPTAIQYYNLKIVTFNYFISYLEVIMISYFYCIFFFFLVCLSNVSVAITTGLNLDLRSLVVGSTFSWLLYTFLVFEDLIQFTTRVWCSLVVRF